VQKEVSNITTVIYHRYHHYHHNHLHYHLLHHHYHHHYRVEEKKITGKPMLNIVTKNKTMSEVRFEPGTFPLGIAMSAWRNSTKRLLHE
jgi:hypothetical protein